MMDFLYKLAPSAKIIKPFFKNTYIYLTALDEVKIPPKGRIIIKSGFSYALPALYEFRLCAVNKKIVLPNNPGTIDPDYRGDNGVISYNPSEEEITIKKGEIICRGEIWRFEEVDIKLNRGTPYAAGYDLEHKFKSDTTIKTGEEYVFKFKPKTFDGIYGEVRQKSGNAIKKGLQIIPTDFSLGEVKVKNLGEDLKFKKDEVFKYAQVVFRKIDAKIEKFKLIKKEELPVFDGGRNEKGFGSTDIKK